MGNLMVPKRTAAQNISSKTTSLFSAQLKVTKYKIRLFYVLNVSILFPASKLRLFQ